MRSSISSSDLWRRFAATFAACAAGSMALIYLFVVTIDPWNVLPLSPPLKRVPISTNARFSFPALARSAQFDSAIVGTSTSRLLRPAKLDARLGTHFVNLSMNAATPYEQSRLLAVFLRHHETPRFVIIGLDSGWCAPAPDRLTARPFPAWMYGETSWRGYLEMFNLYAAQEAINQFGVMIGIKRPPYGLDGYTSFLPDDATYDLARARAHLAEFTASSAPGDPSREQTAFPALALLADLLKQTPPSTRMVLEFVPYYIGLQGAPGTQAATDLAACKRRVVAIAARRPHTVTVDFMIASAITTVDANYWDPRHYRIGVAERLENDIVAAAAGRTPQAGDVLVVTSGE